MSALKWSQVADVFNQGSKNYANYSVEKEPIYLGSFYCLMFLEHILVNYFRVLFMEKKKKNYCFDHFFLFFHDNFFKMND